MSSKYTALPSNDYPSSSQKPIYLPPYQTTIDPLSLSHSHYTPSPFTTHIDIEQDAPQIPNNRHRRAPISITDHYPSFDSDPRFKMETPSPITRAALLAFVCFLFWLAFNLRKGVWIATGMGMEKQDMEGVDVSY